MTSRYSSSPRWAPILVVLILSGCMFGSRRGPSERIEPVTLCIENATVGYGNIIARAGGVSFDVMPGYTVCKNVFGESRLPVVAAATGGGLGRPLRYAGSINPLSAPCWSWRLDNSPASAVSLGPWCSPDEP